MVVGNWSCAVPQTNKEEYTNISKFEKNGTKTVYSVSDVQAKTFTFIRPTKI